MNPVVSGKPVPNSLKVNICMYIYANVCVYVYIYIRI